MTPNLTPNLKRAATFRQLADGLQKTIDEKRAPRTQNATPKRIREWQSLRHDADRLELVQTVLKSLAEAHSDVDNWPAILAIYPQAHELASRKAVEALAYHGQTYLDAEWDGRAKFTPSTLQQLAGGAVAETPARRVRRLEEALVGTTIPGFFPTPAALAREVVRLADIEDGDCVLEPSAGKGDLADAIRAYCATAAIIGVETPGITILLHVCERSGTLRDILAAKGYHVTGTDCFEPAPGQGGPSVFRSNGGDGYDRIVMNPPFENGQDVDHVRHCFDEHLAPGGRLVAVVSNAVAFRTDRKYDEFRRWLDGKVVENIAVQAGAFSGPQAFRQTGVATRILVLDKPTELQAIAHVTAQAAPDIADVPFSLAREACAAPAVALKLF